MIESLGNPTPLKLPKAPTALKECPSTLEDWLSHCEKCHPENIALGLERVQAVAQRLGLNLGPACTVITVAGTNGKGSSCAMLEAIYRQAGYRTALYTSPHLLRFEERLRINGVPIAAEELPVHFAAVEAARGSTALTYFEFTTLAILRAMQNTPLDVAILEVGLGGRLDAVNVLDADCALLTSIDIDHVAFLGNSREAIGREKAGIFRKNAPAVVSDPLPPASVQAYAQAIGAPLYLQGKDFYFTADRQQWSFTMQNRSWGGLAYPALRGANQLLNAAGVLAVVRLLANRLPVSMQAIRQGLSTVQCLGRFQTLPGQPVVVLDVAHNLHSVASLMHNLDAMGYFPITHAVFGAMADKDIAGMLAKCMPLVDQWYFCDLPTPRAATAQALFAHWQAQAPEHKARQQAKNYSTPQEAWQAAKANAKTEDRIVIFGSFYTVAALLPQLGHATV